MFRQYRPLEKGEFIVAWADTSAGLGDFCACQFLSKTKIDYPLVYHSPKLATEMTDELYPVLNKIYDVTGVKPVIAYERNNGGLFEMERLATLNKEGKFTIFTMPTYGNIDNAEPKKLGWDTNTATRPKMLSDYKEAVDKRVVRIYDKPTIEEMYSFIIVRTSASVKAQAEQNAHDDLVMSGAGAWQMYQMCEPEQEFATSDFPDDTGWVAKI